MRKACSLVDYQPSKKIRNEQDVEPDQGSQEHVLLFYCSPIKKDKYLYDILAVTTRFGLVRGSKSAPDIFP